MARAKFSSIADPKRRAFAAMVSALDDAVGTLLAALRRNGIEENTLLFFLSDNGGTGGVGDNRPLRGGKGSTWEGGIRVPLIIKWPGVAKAGSVVSVPVTSTDLYPTCLAAVGQPLRPHQHMDGVNLQSVLTGEGPLSARSHFWHYPHYNEHPSSVPSSVIRKGRWKLIETFDPEGIELYNLSDDLSETQNLAGQSDRSALKTSMSSQLDALLSQRVKPVTLEPATKKAEKKKDL